MRKLGVGEIVEVRSEVEILATLDERAELESLPFMPEMLQFCGRRFRVDKLAVKLCDTIGSTGMYRMRNAVHLAGVRCDGQAHGAVRPAASSTGRRPGSSGCPWTHAPSSPAAEPAPQHLLTTLTAATHKSRGGASPDEELFSCQATDCYGRRPSASLPGTSASTCWMCGRACRPAGHVRAVAIGVFNEYQDFSRRFLPKSLWIRAGMRCHSSRGGSGRPQTALSTCSPGSSSGSGARRRSSARLT